MSEYMGQGKSSKSYLLKQLTGRASGGKVTPIEAVHKHEDNMHKGKKRTAFATGGAVEDEIDGVGPLERLDRPKRKKKGGKSDITIVIDVGKDKEMNPPAPVPPMPMPAPSPAPMGGSPMGGAPMAPKPPMPQLGGGGGMPMARKSGGRVAKADGGKAESDNAMEDKASDGAAKAYDIMSSDERKGYTDMLKSDYGMKCGGKVKKQKRAWGGRSNYPVGHPQNPNPVPEAKDIDPDTLPESARKKLTGKASGGKVSTPNGKAGVDSGKGRLNQSKFYGRKD